MRDPWKHLMGNVELSAAYGSNGGRELLNPNTNKPLSRHSGPYSKGRYRTTKLHEITITIEDLKELWKIQKGKCYWLGIDMSLEDLFVPYSPFAVSVERLDSDRGYHKDNIALTTRFANKGRGKYDNSNFKKRLDDLLENRSKENIKIPNFVSVKQGSLEEFFG